MGVMIIDNSRFNDCVNKDRENHICLRCGQCGRMIDESKERYIEFLQGLFIEDERIDTVLKTVCPHAWRGGSKDIGNGHVDYFLCRYYIDNHRRHDEMLMFNPYTDEELVEAVKKKLCVYYFGEFCERAAGFRVGGK